jgi:hypothetical protein
MDASGSRLSQTGTDPEPLPLRRHALRDDGGAQSSRGRACPLSSCWLRR